MCSLLQWLGALVLALLFHGVALSRCLTLGVVPCGHEGPSMQPVTQAMQAVASHLEQRGHTLRHFTTRTTSNRHWWLHEEALEMDSMDAVMGCGQAGHDVYDYAEAAAVPYVKFSSKEDASWQDAPLWEWPDMIVSSHGGSIPGCFSSVPALLLPTAAAEVEQVADALIGLAEAGKAAGQCGATITDQLSPPLPLLALSMILKNEAPTITSTLLSAKPHIDYWAILDTGSTDNTQQLVAEALAGVPGQLLLAPFRDFSASRNRALRALQGRARWLMVLDADHQVQGAWRLQRAVARLAAACADASLPVCGKALMVQRRHGPQSLYWTRVWPTDGTGSASGWHYIYPVHELPVNPQLLPSEQQGPQELQYKYCSQVVMVEGISPNKSAHRWRSFDLPVLEAERAARPGDPRVAFYYAQTLDCLGEDAAAVAAYQARVDLGAGWWEETYMAMLRKGRVEARMQGRDPTASLLQAHAYNPARAEALYELALWHDGQVRQCGEGNIPCRQRHHLMAYKHAHEAASKERQLVTDVLFVEEGVYAAWARDLASAHAWFAWDGSQGLGDIA